MNKKNKNKNKNKIFDKILMGSKILIIKLTKRYKPLIVSWRITNKCNLNCIYCKINKNEIELTTNECKLVIDNLKKKKN